MKKKLFFVVMLLGLIILPMSVMASPKIEDYKTNTLEEVLAEEKIEKAFDTLESGEDKVKIYLFRGNGCTYCKKFLEFMNSIVEEYGKYFEVVSFESWYDADNGALMEEVSTFLGEPAQGVPYIVIGDQAFGGYAESYNEAIIGKIQEEYAKENNKYDVFEEMAKAEKAAARAENAKTNKIIIFNFVFVALGTTTVIMFNSKQNKQLVELIEKQNKSKK